jgi:hypothetical protein
MGLVWIISQPKIWKFSICEEKDFIAHCCIFRISGELLLIQYTTLYHLAFSRELGDTHVRVVWSDEFDCAGMPDFFVIIEILSDNTFTLASI